MEWNLHCDSTAGKRSEDHGLMGIVTGLLKAPLTLICTVFTHNGNLLFDEDQCYVIDIVLFANRHRMECYVVASAI